MISRIRTDEELDRVVRRARWNYQPRNLHYRRRLEAKAKHLLVAFFICLAIESAIGWAVLRLLGVV